MASLKKQPAELEQNSKALFAKLPFELQRDILQHLLVAENDQVIHPEAPHSETNEDCFEGVKDTFWQLNNKVKRTKSRANATVTARDPPCYHKTLNTQLLYISRDITSVAAQVLYGCNHFSFSSVSLFNKFTNTINPLGVQSLRYLTIDYPTCRSFQVASLRRLVMGTEILDLQVLQLNMRNQRKTHGEIVWEPSAAAERFIDLLEGLKESESAGNNEILFTINENFDINIGEVRETLLRVRGEMSARQAGLWTIPSRLEDRYCPIKLTRKSKRVGSQMKMLGK